ncbi:DUF1289 domain-containing protein [Alphaproteobacteria bacterium LSUCC0684]
MLLDPMRRASQADHSPCVGHCTYDAGGHCLSCRRHEEEVGIWRDASPDDRLRIWSRLPGEIDAAGRDMMRLPLDSEDIAALALEMLADGGAWVMGVAGFWLAADTPSGAAQAVSRCGSTRISLDLSGKIRALAWARGDRKLADGVGGLPIVLVTPRGRVDLPSCHEETGLEDGRVDLGLGLASARVLKNRDKLEVETGFAHGITSLKPDGAFGWSAVPEGLRLNESYALGAILLPRGEAPLT